MEDKNALYEQIASMRQSFFDEEILDEQYELVEELDQENPHFVEEVMTMFLRDSTELVANIEEALEKSLCDLSELDSYLHQLKGSSSSVGAKRVWAANNELREILKEGDIERFKIEFKKLQQEHELLKGKLEPYYQLTRQVEPPKTDEHPN